MNRLALTVQKWYSLLQNICFLLDNSSDTTFLDTKSRYHTYLNKKRGFGEKLQGVARKHVTLVVLSLIERQRAIKVPRDRSSKRAPTVRNT
jgi:hypothetical protein